MFYSLFYKSSGNYFDMLRLSQVMKAGGHSVEHVGPYEYDKTNILGHGAFAVVYKGVSRVVC